MARTASSDSSGCCFSGRDSLGNDRRSHSDGLGLWHVVVCYGNLCRPRFPDALRHQRRSSNRPFWCLPPARSVSRYFGGASDSQPAEFSRSFSGSLAHPIWQRHLQGRHDLSNSARTIHGRPGEKRRTSPGRESIGEAACRSSRCALRTVGVIRARRKNAPFAHGLCVSFTRRP